MTNHSEIKALTDPALDRRAEEIAAEQALRDEAGRQAAAEPLPGPAREAFSVAPNVKVGPFKVRPACDRDLKTLSQLGNAYYKFVMTGDQEHVQPGQDAYELCWVMTRAASREVKAFTEKHGLDALRKAADDEFGELATADLMRVVAECARQIALSCATVVEHKAPDQPGENGEAAKRAHPPSSAPSTARGG